MTGPVKTTVGERGPELVVPIRARQRGRIALKLTPLVLRFAAWLMKRVRCEVYLNGRLVESYHYVATLDVKIESGSSVMAAAKAAAGVNEDGEHVPEPPPARHEADHGA